MEQTKTKEVNTSATPSKQFDKEKVLAYVVLGFLGLVAFGFGGSQYTYLLSAIGFLVAIAILALLPYKASPKENKELLYYAIPLGVFAVFSSFSKFWFQGTFSSVSSGLINCFGIAAFFAIGFLSRKMKYISMKGVLFAVLLGLGLLALISTIASLAEYGFFYAIRYNGMDFIFHGQRVRASDIAFNENLRLDGRIMAFHRFLAVIRFEPTIKFGFGFFAVKRGLIFDYLVKTRSVRTLHHERIRKG